jgi:soluble P-type ATPase
VPLPGVTEGQLSDAAQLSSLAGETPEGRSVVVLAKERYGLRAPAEGDLSHARWVRFTARTRMSGVDLRWGNGAVCAIRKGAAQEVIEWVRTYGGHVPPEARSSAVSVAGSGGTPLLVAVHDRDGPRVLGLIHVKDVVKDGIRERFAELRRMGIRTVMITGDHPLTARAIAEEAGVDDYLAEASPEDKLALIKREQGGGKLVAMTGDGTNDAPALARADVGVAMNTGTAAAKEAGNMVDLDSDPTKIVEIVEIGKQLLITRGALTTFSLTNDVAKYFAIIPAMFAGAHPGLTSQPGSATRPSNTGVAPNPHAALLETPSPVGRDGAAADTRARPGPRRTRHRRGLDPRHMGRTTALAASGLGWAALHKDRILAVACAHLLSSTHEDIACLTVPEHRREHLALACVTAPCTDIAARGHTASWSCSRDNRPGRLLAWTAGFRLEREYVHYVTGSPARHDHLTA